MRVIALSVASAMLMACGHAPHSHSDDAGADSGNTDSGSGDAGSSDAGGCTEGAFTCRGQEVFVCSADGQWTLDHACPADERCVAGACLDDCDPLALPPTNVGCEFWAVDLDNEYAEMMGMTIDAAAAQLGLTLVNPNACDASVTVYENVAPFGSPVQEQIVFSDTVLAESQLQVDLPQREVDGSMGQNGAFVPNSGSGSFASSHGYRIVSSSPVVAVQHNPIVDRFSNDGSLLLPSRHSGAEYHLVGWTTANPCGDESMPMPSIPDHSYVTIVGQHPATTVTVYLTHPIMGSASPSGLTIPETPAGEAVSFSVGPYDIVNLESLQYVGDAAGCQAALAAGQDGDFTGTVVQATQPVTVFVGHERGMGFAGASPPMPPGMTDGPCCTDHFEEQALPLSALGTHYVVPRSPVRSADPSYIEPDLYRILATQNGTVVETSLGAPFDLFTLDAGEAITIWAETGFTLDVTGGPVALAQVLVPGNMVPSGSFGDPSFLLIPPRERHLEHLWISVPPTLAESYLVISYLDGVDVTLDGTPMSGLLAECDEAPIPSLVGPDSRQLSCLTAPGAHFLTGSGPIGVAVYGYGAVSSYAFTGGLKLGPTGP
jgi:hypothetical protein